MVKSENKIVGDIKRFYGEIKGLYNIKKVFLYGSFATGRWNKDSDIDVGIVIDGLEKMDEIKVLGQLYRKTQNINTLIEPYCVSYKEYKKPQRASILESIIKSGITIVD